MRLLFIHSDPFSYRVTEKTQFAEAVSDETPESAELRNALVVFIAAEKPDEAYAEEVAERVSGEIVQVHRKLGSEWIVLYPYAHLSNNLAAPAAGLKIIRGIHEKLAGFQVVRCPFGWYKAFHIAGKGHPLSELSRMIEIRGGEVDRSLRGWGREHPVAALCQRFREAFLSLGLDEAINPAIVEERHVYMQYGQEAPLILDRVYYLAGLDRADIGLSREKEEAIRGIVPGFDGADELRALLREYKEAAIEADDFLEEMARRLRITGDQAGDILEKVFPEFRELKPAPTKKTLRSHMTTNWFPVLRELQKKRPLPIRLFSVGSRFRREQRQDPHHLFESTSASVVAMDGGLTMDDGKKLTREILKKLGFRKCSFRVKETASRYYVPETDTEVFIGCGGKDVEVGNLGFYSPAALKNYDIEVPVFNVGFGVERVAMILAGAGDLRALVYPQFYEEASFTDEEIAALLRTEREPQGEVLRNAVGAMVRGAVEARNTVGPVEVELYAGAACGRDVRFVVFNWDEGKPLMSMAALNTVLVHDGNIYGVPPKHDVRMGDKLGEVYEKGAATGLTFIDMMVKGFAAEVERRMAAGEKGPYEERWKIAKRPNQINLAIPSVVYDYIEGRRRNIRVGGPLFFGLKADW
ncbi:MAG: O-phosphoserine--tRNA ligase [bacterium]